MPKIVRGKDWKEEVALMILLWKDFKSDGKFDANIAIESIRFADDFGVKKEYEELLPKIPAMRIVLR